MEPIPNLFYNAEFLDGANRFEDFERKYQEGKLCVWKNIKAGKLLYRYSDGAILLNNKCIHKNRRKALITLFNFQDKVEYGYDKQIPTNLVKYGNILKLLRLSGKRSKTSQTNIPGAETGYGAVIKFDNEWMEVTQIIMSKITRGNGMNFTEDRPASALALPGYDPMTSHIVKVITPKEHKRAIIKFSSLEGELKLWVRPSDLRIFIPHSQMVKYKGLAKSLIQRPIKPLRIKGLITPVAAACAAQLPRLLGI